MGNGIKPTVYSHFTLGDMAADIMTDEELELIKDMRPGLIQLEIGVQSTNAVTLEKINRKTGCNARKQMLTRR